MKKNDVDSSLGEIDKLNTNTYPEQRYLEALKELCQGDTDLYQKLKEKTLEVEQLKAEKEKFFNIVAFWLKSPLNSLETLTRIILADVYRLDAKGMAGYLEHLYKQVTRTQNDLKNLIEWSCLEVNNYEFRPTDFSIKEILDEVYGKYLSQAERKNIQFTKEVNVATGVHADQRMIKLVLENLVVNAIMFSRSGDQVFLSATIENDKVKLEVKDNGVGMGKSKLANVFNIARKSLQRGTANEQGFGLGLMVCKELLEVHGEELRLSSVLSEGTSAFFHLPLAKAVSES